MRYIGSKRRRSDLRGLHRRLVPALGAKKIVRRSPRSESGVCRCPMDTRRLEIVAWFGEKGHITLTKLAAKLLATCTERVL